MSIVPTPLRSRGRARRSLALAAFVALALPVALGALGPAQAQRVLPDASRVPGGPAAASAPGGPAIELRDDWGRAVRLPARPSRIVSLAPHATELLFAAGAGAQVIAAEPSSDQPAQARALPRVSALPRPDPEQLLALRPDLVVLWGAAVGHEEPGRLEAFGLAVFVSQPSTLDDVASTLERLAPASARPHEARSAAAAYRERLAALRARYASRAPVPVFLQLSSRPLITLSDRDVLGDAVRSCGGRNVFGDAPVAAPRVDAERVLRAAPRLVVSLDPAAAPDLWARLGLLAPRGGAGYVALDASIQRPVPRALGEVQRLCEAIDAQRRGSLAQAPPASPAPR